ncbi:WYL domain-containing protein [Flavicella sp.]|uniref:helix-turn-helix transcriptional regulator n=1 Tax=Flavicella sp. TaxID=2957742 RepID=UPI0030183B5D
MLLQTAITNFELLEISYNSLQKIHTKRFIEPFALYSTQENWLLIAFCRLRSEFRMFRVDCVTQISQTQTYFESHNMTLEEFYQKKMPNK